MSLPPNTNLGRYVVRSKLGEGGMGEIYLAEDSQLERTVALKILPAQAAQDQQRMHRFLQEARAASRLNHPNAAHIYEIGEANGTHFIAMEYVEGQSLDTRINGRPLEVEEISHIGIQIADALEEAHSKGITHRDIKPSNIIVTPRGQVKVLDFGLAKVANLVASPDSELATRVKTAAGMIMGTVNYMSPEQALGRELDHRTDIFSVGVVLYEMATGRLPFTGESVTETIDKIAHAQPEAIARLNYDIPAELEQLIRKALRKDRDERYQTAKDMRADLRSLKRDLEFSKQLQRSVPPDSTIGRSSATSTLNANPLSSTADSTAQDTGSRFGTTPTHTTSSAEYIVGEFKRHKTGVAIAGLVLLLAVAGVVFAIIRFREDEPAAPFAQAKITKLTANGKVTQAVISPDGRQVVYVVNDGGRRRLWLRQIATASDVELNTPEDMQFWGMTISPDGNFLYTTYGVGGRSNNRDLYQMPILGGAPTKIIENIDSPISFHPNGKQFAFVRNNQGESALMIANSDGSGERKIATRTFPNTFGNIFNGAVAWAPDGTRIAALAINVDSAGEFMNVVEVPAVGGAERLLTSQRWVQLNRLSWLGDGSGLVMTGVLQPAEPNQLWFLSYANGEARRITNDLNNYGTVSVSADFQTLVTVQEDLATKIWIAPHDNERQAEPIASAASNAEGASGLTWTPDDKIIYHSVVGGVEDVWIMDADGKNRRQLTADETSERRPSVSTDGRYIVFASDRAGNRNIWRMDIDGRNPKRLTTARGNVPQANAEWVVYHAARALWKIPINGGEPAQLGEKHMVSPAMSPDGKLIACSFDPPGAHAKLAILSIEGGPPFKIFDVQLRLPAEIHWSPDGRNITYVSHQNGVSDIWSQPYEGGEPKKLTDFKANAIFSFSWSRDNRLAISHGSYFSDVFLIRNVR